MRPIKVTSLFQFYNALMKMFNLIHIPIKLISRQAATSSCIPTPFQGKVYSNPQPAGTTGCSPLLILSLT